MSTRLNRLFLDTEFNSHNGELISIALVADISEFYEVVKIPINPHPFVSQHVIPVLNKAPIGFEATRDRLHQWLNQFGSIEVYADWAADFQHFFHLLLSAKEMHSYSPPVLVAIMARPPTQPMSKIPHNALSDAHALKEAWTA